MLKKKAFDSIYAFWDGDNSGQLRYNLYPEYKANRDKNYKQNETEYYRKLNEYSKQVIAYSKRNLTEEQRLKKANDKELFFEHRNILMNCLEELCIRQLKIDDIEGDDLIGYYCLNRGEHEKIVILSRDRDIAQLVDENTIVYISEPKFKNFITIKSWDYIKVHPANIVLYKTIVGDNSDNIKGIKGVGDKTLFENFPQFLTRPVMLDEILKRTEEIQEERKKMKKQPFKWGENILNRVTEGSQGGEIYEINEQIINLRKPLMNEEAIRGMDELIGAPLDMSNRNIENLYKLLLKHNISELTDRSDFSNFFYEFLILMKTEENKIKDIDGN
jgi:5'-3' exonuclease